MFECRLNEFVVEILQQYNAALGLNNPPPTAQLLNAMASFVKQNTIKSLKLSFDGGNSSLIARAEFNDNKFSESTVDLSSLKYDLDVYDLAEKLEGSDTIVVDINEDGDKVEIHLDSDVVAKIDRALLMPVSAPTEFELVGINEQKEQVRVKLGEGVEYDAETQTIKANGSGGTKLYRHMVGYGTMEIISTRKEKYTVSEFENIFDTGSKASYGILSIYIDNGYFLVVGADLNANDSARAYYVTNSQISSQIVYYGQDTLDLNYSVIELG